MSYIKGLPTPGDAPTIKLADVVIGPRGTRLAGLAPIGIRWGAALKPEGIKPDDGCPRSEFLATHAFTKGCWHEII